VILTITAYDLDRDLARAYDEAFERLRDDDWACFVDHDAMFTTYDWFRQLARVVEAAPPSTGMVTAVTNRIGCVHQRAPGAPRTHDYAEHRRFGAELAERHGDRLSDVTHLSPISGVVMLIPKRAWAAIGRPPSGFLGVDNWIHLSMRKAGWRVFLMPGLYVYHWYRADGAEHLSDATRVAREELSRVAPARKKKPRARWPRH
jgi:GT2 family glycosyltransferase